jgi:hypothetical protein
MANYIVTTDFAAKDALPTGNPGKVAQGTQLDTELDNIATAIATKEDTANKGSANGYAGLDSSADVPRAQLPSAIAYEDEANTFSQQNDFSNLRVVGQLNYTTGVSGFMEIVNRALGALGLRIYLGAGGTTPIVEISSAGAITAAGNTVWTSANDGSGSGLDADTVDGQQASAFAASSHNHSASEITSGTLAIARGGTGQTDGTARNVTGKAGVAKTLSTSAPSGGSDGDIWYRY